MYTHPGSRRTVVILVFSEQQNPDGSMHDEYMDRIDRGLQVAKEAKRTGDSRVIVFVGGGDTRGFGAEAVQALAYATSTKPYGVELLSEDRSKTTPENIVEAQAALRDAQVTDVDLIVCVGRETQIPKIKVLMPRLWELGAPKLEYESGEDTKPLWYQVADLTLFMLLAYVDAHERHVAKWVNRWVKKILRNG